MVNRKDFLALFLLLFIFLFFHGGVLFKSNVYIHLWGFKNHVPFQNLFPKQYNVLTQSSDYVTQLFANKYVISEALKKGELPLWSPYNFCGFPLYANGSSAAFSPFNLLLFFFTPYRAYIFQLLIMFLVGGGCLYFLLRSCFKCDSFASFCGTFTYLFSPSLLANIDIDTVLGFIWLFPLLLLILESCFKKKNFFSFVILGGVLALGCYTTHAYITLNALLLVFIYFLVKLFTLPSVTERKKLSIFFLVSIFIFFGLSFIQLAPFLEFLLSSQRVVPGASTTWFIPSDFVSGVYPVLFNLRKLTEILSFVIGTPISVTVPMYVGVIPFWSGFVIFLYHFKENISKELRIFVYLFSAYIVYDLLQVFPFFEYLNRKTFLGFVFGSRFFTLYVLSSAILTGWLFAQLQQSHTIQRIFLKVCKSFLIFVVAPMTILSFFFTILFPFLKQSLMHHFLSKVVSGSDLLTGGSPYVFSYALDKMQEWLGEAYRLISLESFFMWVPFLAVMVGISLKWFMKRDKLDLFRGLLFLTVLIDALYFGYQTRPSILKDADVFKSNESLSFLVSDKELFRFASIQPQSQIQKAHAGRVVLKPNLGVVYGLSDIGGHDSLIDHDYVAFTKGILSKTVQPFEMGGVVIDFKDLDLKLAGMLNVKYLLSDEQENRVFEGAKLLLKKEGMAIYKNPYFLPRAYFVSHYRVESNREEVFRTLRALDYHPKESVMLEKDPGVNLSSGSLNSSIHFINYGHNKVELEIKTDGSGFLVLADRYDEGWRASLDGKGVPIYRTNAILRSVFVPVGEHKLTFSYEPWLFKVGLYLALMTVCCLMMVFLYHFLLAKQTSI